MKENFMEVVLKQIPRMANFKVDELTGLASSLGD